MSTSSTKLIIIITITITIAHQRNYLQLHRAKNPSPRLPRSNFPSFSHSLRKNACDRTSPSTRTEPEPLPHCPRRTNERTPWAAEPHASDRLGRVACTTALLPVQSFAHPDMPRWPAARGDLNALGSSARSHSPAFRSLLRSSGTCAHGFIYHNVFMRGVSSLGHQTVALGMHEDSDRMLWPSCERYGLVLFCRAFRPSCPACSQPRSAQPAPPLKRSSYTWLYITRGSCVHILSTMLNLDCEHMPQWGRTPTWTSKTMWPMCGQDRVVPLPARVGSGTPPPIRELLSCLVSFSARVAEQCVSATLPGCQCLSCLSRAVV